MMKRTIGTFLALCLVCVGSANAQILVQTELMLLCDISGSISSDEYYLQQTGYSNAFRSTAVQTLIEQTPGGIAASLVWWSGHEQQAIGVDWMQLTDATTCVAFADAIDGTVRPFNGLTAPGSAINFGTPLFWTNDFESEVQIMDVSGDGIKNDGLSTAAQRDAALTAGIDRINGLAIESTDVFSWYQGNVQGGEGAFTMFATGFDTFETAIEEKILYELEPVPEPATMGLLGVGLGALVAMAWRRRQAQ